MGSPVVRFEIVATSPPTRAARKSQAASADGGRPNPRHYVEVNDLQAVLDDAEKKNVVPVTELSTATYALFADPEGNVVVKP